MSAYDEIRVRFPTAAITTYPPVAHYLKDFDEDAPASPEVYQEAGGTLTVACWADDPADAHHALLHRLETARIPYDTVYAYTPQYSEIAWYRPDATPDHDRYTPGDGEDPQLAWSTLIDLAGGSDVITLTRVRAAAHLPPNDLDDNARGPLHASTAPIPWAAIAQAYAASEGEATDGPTLRRLLRNLRDAEDPLSLASRLESVAHATLAVFSRYRIPPGAPNPLQDTVALARMFDTAEARLILYHATHVLYDQAAPATGQLSVWRDLVRGVWEALERFIARTGSRSFSECRIQSAPKTLRGISHAKIHHHPLRNRGRR